MTRRKRTPSPDRSHKRVAFDIPASLHHFSALSRSLVVQNGVVNHEKENSTIVARAQALSQSPTNGPASAYDPRQFPSQQEWPRPAPNPGAVGHARFLEKQWQTAQATQVAENMRRAEYMRQQMEEVRQQMGREPQQMEKERDVSTLQQTSSNDVISRVDTPLAPASGDIARAKAGEHPDESQPQSGPTPPCRGAQRQRFELGIEQRRQAVIAKLMETKPASIATSSSNIQIPTGTQAEAGRRPPLSQSPARAEGQVDGSTHSEQIAALIAKKRAENAANGSLNRWLSTRQNSQRPSHHHATQDLDLSSLFSSPAPSHDDATAAGSSSQADELGHAADKTNVAQLPSPSISSPSPSEVRWMPSPSAQLLINLAQAAPAPPLPSQAQHSFRAPSLTLNTEALAPTSSIKPALWAPFNSDKLDAATRAFVDTGTPDMLAQPTTASGVVTNHGGAAAGSIAVGVGSDYGMAAIDALAADTTMYPGPQSAVYTAFGGRSTGGAGGERAGGRANTAHFAMPATNNSSARHQQHSAFAVPQP
ncbi:hypothetical protein DV737_g5045, partial [Chaetothyriales sp. CBS 132003]